MKRRASGLCIIIIALAVFFSAGVSAAYARTVRVGLYENEPKIFTNDEGKPSGIFVDLLNAIAKEQGWELKYVHGTWDECLANLETGKIDLMPDVAYSAKRDIEFDFHKTPVVQSWSYVYAGPDVKVERLSDLRGKSVAVLEGSIQQTEFQRMVDGFGYDVDLVPVKSLAEGFELASQGKADAAIANYLNGDYFYRQYGLTKTPVVFNAVPLYYATAEGKNHDLLNKIDLHLNYWISEPGSIYYTTLARYTGAVPAELLPPYALWIIAGIGVLLVLSAGMILLLRWRVEVQTKNLRDATEAAETAKETLRLALDAAEEGIFDWNPQTGEIAWTAHTYTMLGYEPFEFDVDLDKWTSLVHPDDVDVALQAIWEGITEGDRSFSIECRMRMKDGSYLWVASHGKAIELDSDGQVVRVVGTNADIQERRVAEDEVLRLNVELESRVRERTARLETANQDLESFSYSVSHDLRAPLRAISGFAQIVSRRHRSDMNDEGQHYVDNIVQASERMGHLIDDLLTYSRLGRQAVEVATVPLGEVLDSVVGDLDDRIKESGAAVTVPEDLPEVCGERTLLARIFTNLIDNALTYHRPDASPEVDIGWATEDGCVRVWVKDNGIGIPAEYQDKVFNIFQRLHGEDEYPGTGIGLANVKKCAEMMSGSVSLESEPGAGSTFTLTLPKG